MIGIHPLTPTDGVWNVTPKVLSRARLTPENQTVAVKTITYSVDTAVQILSNLLLPRMYIAEFWKKTLRLTCYT